MTTRRAGSAKGREALPAWPGLVALAFALSFAFFLCVFPAVSFDVWWHLRSGRLILETGRIPHADPYTYTAAGRPWITHEWLAEVIFFLLHRAGGIDLLILFKAALAAAALAASAWAGCASRGAPARRALPAAALGALLAAPLVAPRAFIRPHMFTALFLGVTLLLLRLRTATGRERYRNALIPLFIVWANLHSGFVLGLALVLLYWAGEIMEERGGSSKRPVSWRRRAAYVPILVGATLLNPNGYRALLYPFRLVATPGALENIAELRSVFDPAYRGALFLDVLIAACVVLAACIAADVIRSRLKARWSMILPALVFFALALRSLRGVSEFAVLLPATIAALGPALARRRRTAAVACASVALFALAGGSAAIRWGQPMGADPPRRVGLGVDRANCPEAAARFLREEAPPGRIFNVLGFGGYLIDELWPERQVYIDGRLDVFPAGFLSSYVEMVSTGTGWQETVDRYGIAFAVLDYTKGPAEGRDLHARLQRDPNWACVCFGDDFVVYARRVGTNEALIEKFGTPFDPSDRTEASIDAFLAGAPPDRLERAVSALRNIATFAPDEKAPSLALGMLLARAGRYADAVAPLRNAARLDPASYVAHLRLGIAEAELGRYAEARTSFARALEIRPNDPAALKNLTILESMEKKNQAPPAPVTSPRSSNPR